MTLISISVITAAPAFDPETSNTASAPRPSVRSRVPEPQRTLQLSSAEALAVPTDITQFEQIEHLVAQTLQAFGQIDVLLNNAGFFGRVGFAEGGIEALRHQRRGPARERLPAWVAEHGVDADAVAGARRVARYFDSAAPLHHADEELDLFPLLASDPPAASHCKPALSTVTVAEPL